MPSLMDRALAKRHPLPDAQTNALRLIDGQGDGLPGLILECFAEHWLVSTPGKQLAPAIRDWLAASGRACYWKTLDQHQKQSPSHLCGPTVDEPFLIRENGIRYEVSFQSGYSQGIFLDQRHNRAEVRQRVRPGMTLLNTFAYTGAFSVSAACGGAETTTLDLSQPYLDWAKRNLSHNAIDPRQHHFCKGDTFHWLRRFAKQGRRFDAIILDPPTFSRDDKGKVFRIENDYGELASLATSCLSDSGWMLCCTNFRGISTADFERHVQSHLPRRMRTQHRPMPPDFNDQAYLQSLWLDS